MNDKYQILKDCKAHEHRIFIKVPVKGKKVEYSLAQAPPDLWAARILTYLMGGGVPPEDIRQPEEPKKSLITATCGHKINKVMWHVCVEENILDCSSATFSVVCPECYRRHYRKKRLWAERVVM